MLSAILNTVELKAIYFGVFGPKKLTIVLRKKIKWKIIQKLKDGWRDLLLPHTESKSMIENIIGYIIIRKVS